MRVHCLTATPLYDCHSTVCLSVDVWQKIPGPSTKTAQNVDGWQKIPGPSTKTAQNVDEWQ
ncbi:MAG: hypothetical protein WC128_01840, partial [Bacteroidales bacterium]